MKRKTAWELTETDLKEIDAIFKEENCPTYFDYPMALAV